MSEWTQNVYQHVFTREKKIVSQHALNNRNPCQQSHNIHINLCSLNLTHAHKLHLFLSWTKTLNASEAICCQRWHKIHLSICWANPSYANDDTKCISIYVDHTVPCQHGQNFDRNICWQKPSHSCEDTKCMSPRFDNPIPCQRGQKMYLNMRWPNPALLTSTHNA